MKLKIIILAITGCLSLTTGYSALLLEEDFESLTAAGLNTQNGWTADTGVNVVAGGLDYSNGQIVINGGTKHVQSNILSTGVTPIANNSFAAQDGDVWFSFTMRINQASIGNSNRYWFWASDETSINSGVTGALANSSTGNTLNFAEIRNNTTANPISLGTLATEQVHFIVGRLSKDGSATNTNAYDRMEIWLNPNSLTLGAATATANGPATSGVTEGIQHFGLTTLSTATNLEWDNLQVGTEMSNVVIPEPSTLMLVSIAGLLGVLGLRRTRRFSRR